MNHSFVTVCALNAVGLRETVRRGRKLADQTGCGLRIVLFQQIQRHFRENAELLEYAFQCAKSADAEVDAFYTSDEELIRRQMREGSNLLVMHSGETRLIRLGSGLPAARLEIYQPEAALPSTGSV